MVRRNRGRGRQGGNGPRAANNTNTPAPAPTPDANQSLSTSEDWGSFEASINNLNVGQYSGNNRAGAATRPAAPVGQAAVPRPAAPVRQAPAPRPAAPRPAAPVRQVAAPRPSPSPPAGVNSAWATPSPSASSNSAWTTPRPSYSNAAASRQPTVSSTPGSSWASVVGSNSRQSRTSQSPVVSSSTPASSEWTPTDAPPTGPRPLTSLASSEAGWDQAHLYSMPGRARTGVNQNAVQPVPGFTPKDPENSVKSRRDGNLLPWDLDPTFPMPKVSKVSLTFNYYRPWASLGKNVREKLAKYLDAQRIARLPPLFHDLDEDKALEYRNLYDEQQMRELFDVRMGCRHLAGRRLLFASDIGDNRPVTENVDSPFLRVMKVPELATAIIHEMGLNLVDLVTLSRTCVAMKRRVALSIEVWDTTTGAWLFDDRFRPHFKDGRLVENKAIRPGILALAATSVYPAPGIEPYTFQFDNFRGLVRGFSEIPNSFRNVIIDQLSFFDVRAFELMLRSMPNLENVIISRCIHLDVTKLQPLLLAVERNGRLLPHGGTKYVRLDFGPYFFEGPNKTKRLGSWGVTHNEPIFSIPKAVMGLILSTRTLTKKVGVNLLDEKSSFWNFVRRLPGPDGLWGLKARDAIIAKERAVASLEQANTRGSGVLNFDAKMKKISGTFADDITAATTGDNLEPIQPPWAHRNLHREHEEYGYWRRRKNCKVCKYPHYLSFFTMKLKVCWVCKMNDFVNTMEDSHFRYREQAILDQYYPAKDTEEWDKATFADIAELPDEDPVVVAKREVEEAKREAEEAKKPSIFEEARRKADEAWERDYEAQVAREASKSASQSIFGQGSSAEPENTGSEDQVPCFGDGNLQPPPDLVVASVPRQVKQSAEERAAEKAASEAAKRWTARKLMRDTYIGLAKKAAVDADKAWAYHIMFHTGAGDTGLRPPYPEPVESNPVAASLRRWKLYKAREVEAQDFRNGGPQYSYPMDREIYGSEASEWYRRDAGPEDFATFCGRWRWSEGTDKALISVLETQIDEAKIRLQFQTRHILKYLQEARRRRDSKEAKYVEWVSQNLYDLTVALISRARFQDQTYSGIGPGRRSWNRDKLLEDQNVLNRRKNYERYRDGKGFFD